jgi:hypothetical protein
MKIKSKFKSLRYVKDTGWFISETPVSEYKHYDDVAIDPDSDYEVFDAHIFDGLPTPTESALFSLQDGQIVIPPVDLPTNINMDWQWAVADFDGVWMAYSDYPGRLAYGWKVSIGRSSVLNGELFTIPPDPQGWRNSLHKRQPDGTWQRAASPNNFSEISEK